MDPCTALIRAKQDFSTVDALGIGAKLLWEGTPLEGGVMGHCGGAVL